jgi:hypothetical protein
MRSETDRHAREAIKKNAFGGTCFKVTRIVIKSSFRAFKEIDNINPVYDRKEKSRVSDPEKFDGNRQNFDNWIIKLVDKFDEDVIIFKTEKSHIRYLINNITGKAKRSIEIRYQSEVRPFSCITEMIQALAAAFQDPNQYFNALTIFRNLNYKLKNDIHEFISEFNLLA